MEYGASFLARVFMLNTKRGWIWGFGGALITMEGFHGHHSQRLMDFVSTECQVQGNLVTLDFWILPHPIFRLSNSIHPFS